MKLQFRELGQAAGFLVQVIVGILLMLNPVGVTSAIIVAFGLVVVVRGIWSVLKYFIMDPEEAMKAQTLYKGLVLLLAGLFCVCKSRWFFTTFPVLAIIYGIAVLLTGLLKVQHFADHLRLRQGGWFLYACSALITTVCGIVILTDPFGTSAVLWLFTGASLVAQATFDAVCLLIGRKQKKEHSNRQILEAE